jgi:hypothetical protein
MLTATYDAEGYVTVIEFPELKAVVTGAEKTRVLT